MSEKPILFRADMNKAIQGGTKTQTRRVIKPQPEIERDGRVWWKGDWDTRGGPCAGVCSHGTCGNGEPTWTLDEILEHAPYQPGDLLWVKQVFWQWGSYEVIGEMCKKLNRFKKRFVPAVHPARYEVLFEQPAVVPMGRMRTGYHKRSPLFMPKEFAQTWVKVKSVRIEQVQDIRACDIAAEGVDISADGIYTSNHFRGDCWQLFQALWDSINKKRGYGWDENPWEFAYEFEKI